MIPKVRGISAVVNEHKYAVAFQQEELLSKTEDAGKPFVIGKPYDESNITWMVIGKETYSANNGRTHDSLAQMFGFEEYAGGTFHFTQNKKEGIYVLVREEPSVPSFTLEQIEHFPIKEAVEQLGTTKDTPLDDIILLGRNGSQFRTYSNERIICSTRYRSA